MSQRPVVQLRGGVRLHVHDDGKHDPLKHPHAPPGTSKGGQFVKKAPTVGTTVLGPIFKAHGLTKAKHTEPGHLATYNGPHGVKVHIHHPPQGQWTSTSWTSHAPGHSPKQGQGKALGALLTSHAQRAGQPAEVSVKHLAEPEKKELKVETMQKAHPALELSLGAHNRLVEMGYQFVEGSSGTAQATYVKPSGAQVVFTKAPHGATWVSTNPGNQPKQGDNPGALVDLLSGKNPATIEFVKHAPPPPAAPPAPKAWTEMGSIGHGEYHTHTYGAVASHAPEATPAEREAISKYSGNSYGPLNKAFRSGGMLPSNLSATITALDSYLDRSRIGEDTVLFRGVQPAFAKKAVEMGVGEQFVDNGYASHSTAQATARSFAADGALLVVRVPKGAHGAAIKAHSHHGHEDEVLFRRGARFRITKIDTAKRHIHVDMVV